MHGKAIGWRRDMSHAGTVCESAAVFWFRLGLKGAGLAVAAAQPVGRRDGQLWHVFTTASGLKDPS